MLNSPSINYNADVDKKLADATHAVLQDKQYHFLGGGHHMGWGPEHDGTTLVYKGDSKALDGFLTRLARVKGLRVKIRLSRDLSKQLGSGWWKDAALNEASSIRGAKITPPVPSWEVIHSKQVSDCVEVRINLADKDISMERLLEKWLVELTGEKDK